MVKNQYRVENGKVYIQLTGLGGGYTAVASESDLEKLLEFDVVWYAKKYKSVDTPYACATVRSPKGSANRQYSLLLHRFLTDAPKGSHVDHFNHNTLDCTRENLKVGTQQENNSNSSIYKRNTSGCTGVSFHKPSGKWRGIIYGYEGNASRTKSLGYFETKDEAIQAVKDYKEANP